MSNITCRECGNEFWAEPVIWRGRNIIPASSLCEPCLRAEDAAKQERDRRNAWVMNRNRANVPKNLWNVSRRPDGLTPALTDWINGETQMLVLSGPVGVGKTFAAAWAIWRAWQHRGVRWVAVARAMGQLRASFGDEDRATALQSLMGDRSVVLDDIDKVPGTEQGLSMLLAAIDARVAENSPVLVTMNSSISTLGQQLEGRKGGHIGEAIASRLASGKVISLAGDDKRMAA